jgi:hypothetical protein
MPRRLPAILAPLAALIARALFAAVPAKGSA